MVEDDCPRLLINRERVGEERGGTAALIAAMLGLGGDGGFTFPPEDYYEGDAEAAESAAAAGSARDVNDGMREGGEEGSSSSGAAGGTSAEGAAALSTETSATSTSNNVAALAAGPCLGVAEASTSAAAGAATATTAGAAATGVVAGVEGDGGVGVGAATPAAATAAGVGGGDAATATSAATAATAGVAGGGDGGVAAATRLPGVDRRGRYAGRCYRDALFLGDCDEGVQQLVKLLGWEEDFQRLLEEVQEEFRRGQERQQGLEEAFN